MRSSTRALVCSALAAICASCGGAGGRSPASPGSPGELAEVAFISGTFRGPSGDTEIEECWSEPRARSMLGTGRTMRAGKTVFFEFLAITRDEQGIVYTAWPKGGPSTPFRMTKSSANEVVFENPAHDFPKRILYRKDPSGDLVTRVEGDEAGVPHVEEQRLRPVAR
jgi:hypothetical protein